MMILVEYNQFDQYTTSIKLYNLITSDFVK